MLFTAPFGGLYQRFVIVEFGLRDGPNESFLRSDIVGFLQLRGLAPAFEVEVTEAFEGKFHSALMLDEIEQGAVIGYFLRSDVRHRHTLTVADLIDEAFDFGG